MYSIYTPRGNFICLYRYRYIDRCMSFSGAIHNYA